MLRNTDAFPTCFVYTDSYNLSRLTLTLLMLRFKVAAVKAGSGGGSYTEEGWQRPNAKSTNIKFYKDKSQWNITHDQPS